MASYKKGKLVSSLKVLVRELNSGRRIMLKTNGKWVSKHPNYFLKAPLWWLQIGLEGKSFSIAVRDDE